MRSCRDITVMISKGLDKELGFTERFAIGVHLVMCSRCRNFQNQTRFIRQAAHRYIEHLQNRLDKKS